MSKKNILLIVFSVVLLALILFFSVLYYNKTTKIALKCNIKCNYSHFGQDLWDTFHGELEPADEYFLINIKNKTINDFDWKPLENFKEIIVDDKTISMIETLSDKTEISYIIQRNTGEISGIRTKEDKKNNTKTFYNYEGKCEIFNPKQKF